MIKKLDDRKESDKTNRKVTGLLSIMTTSY